MGNVGEYVVGAYYFKNKADYGYYRSNSVNYLFIDRHVTSISGYADGTLHLGDLALIAGLRYSRERRRQTNGLFVPTLNSRYIAAEDSSWTPRVGVRYALGPRTNIYATYTKGFKSGAFDTASLTNVGVTPEKVNAYEVGFKTTGPVFTFNSAAYYYDYRDIQANTQLITNGIAVSSLRNAGKARIYGLELDGTARISEPFNIRMALAYTNAKYTEFPGAPGYLPLANGGNQSIFIDASGNRMVRAPKYTASLQLNYEAEIAGRELSLSLSPSYTSGLYFDIANTQRQGGVFLLDASAALDLSDQLKVSVFGRNLTDRIYQTYNFQSTFGTQVLFAKPRTYGVSLAYSF